MSRNTVTCGALVLMVLVISLVPLSFILGIIPNFSSMPDIEFQDRGVALVCLLTAAFLTFNQKRIENYVVDYRVNRTQALTLIAIHDLCGTVWLVWFIYHYQYYTATVVGSIAILMLARTMCRYRRNALARFGR